MKSYLVTGGAGSIGRELCRQLAERGGKVTVADISEYNLYDTEQFLKERGLSADYVVADVRDPACLSDVFRDAKPSAVFHAAALKHVPLLQNPLNLLEAVRTNVLGTWNVLVAATQIKAPATVISTDKAVNPISVMGWTKHLAERCVAELARHEDAPSLSFVRFGNVIGSSGSVVPLFHKQLARGGPITITHPDMVRYFMTISEAVELVMMAQELSLENKASFEGYVFDMGEPKRIVDVAEQIIRFSGKRPGADIEIKVIGMRPGERLHEDLTWDAERLEPTRHAKIRRIRSAPAEDSGALLNALSEACDARDTSRVRDLLISLGWAGSV